MKRALIAALAFAAVLPGQINLQITPIPDTATSRVLDKSLSNVLTLYLVTAENQGQESVMLMESVVIKRMQGITEPLDHTFVQMLITEGDKNSWQNRGGRIIADLAKVASFLTAGGIIALGHTGLVTGLSVNALAPYFMQQIRGIAPPIQANYNQIAWNGPILLHDGDTAIRYVFGAKQKAKITGGSGFASYQFIIPTDGLKKIPVVR